jgi:hypothetical protein
MVVSHLLKTIIYVFSGVPCQYPTGEKYLADYYPDAVEHMRRNFWALGGFMVSFLFFTIVAFKIRGIPNLH